MKGCRSVTGKLAFHEESPDSWASRAVNTNPDMNVASSRALEPRALKAADYSFRVRPPNSERWAKALIGSLTLSFGLAGILLVPSGQLAFPAAILLFLASASTVPVALRWLLGPWPGPILIKAFIIWADLGILAVMLLPNSPLLAMSSSAMFAIVALFAIIGTSPRVLGIHLACAVTALLLTAWMSILDGADPWTVSSRAVTVASMFVMPFALRPYIRYLRERADGALRDPLTGLWNRRGLFHAVGYLNTLNASPIHETRYIGVVVIDIDRFKAINARFGHPSGDAVLTEVASRLLHEASADAVVSRLGGDQFVCVHIGSRNQVDDAETRIRAGLEESFSGPPFTTSIGSAGDSLICGDSTDAPMRRLIALADIEMYREKADPAAAANHLRLDPLGIRDRIDALIDSGGPSIVFQPICDTVTRAVVGYEALSRFPFGHGSPYIWFRDATCAGVGPRLELAAIDTALHAMAGLPSDAFVSVNASAETIRTTDMLARLRPHIGARTIYLEITEHERVDDYRAVARSVEDLRAAGVKISVDDVGAGFAGLRQVVELKPDTLKLDYSLVHGVDLDPTRRAAVASLTAFAREVGATLIMEGVETDGELRVAVELGIDMVQGYLTGRPVSAEPAGLE